MASESYVKLVTIDKLGLLNKEGWTLPSFDLEVTARCNLDCRHCYIRRPALCQKTRDKELSIKEILGIGDQAVRMGAIACLITGGEPLLRKDFLDIYLGLKGKGLLVTIFTNATLLTKNIVDAFVKYPPRFVEITVYGANKETYETVTRTPGSHNAFLKGLNLLKANGIPLRLKSMLMRSNMHEQTEIKNFCTEQTREQYRFDPFLHLSFDRDHEKNTSIREERLSPKEIVQLEMADGQRYSCLQKNKNNLVSDRRSPRARNLFFCGAGKQKCVIGYDGKFRLCESLAVPECVYDLRRGSLQDAFTHFVPKVRAITAKSSEYNEKCGICPIINLCMWCPAHAYLETGSMDQHVEYFCEIAKERNNILKNL